jgi:hypothetical protein
LIEPDKKKRFTSYGVTVRDAVFVIPPLTAVRVTDVDAVTALWDTVNVALVCPAATFTVPGIDATLELEEDRVTTHPVEGAGPLSVRVPVTTLVDLP